MTMCVDISIPVMKSYILSICCCMHVILCLVNEDEFTSYISGVEDQSLANNSSTVELVAKHLVQWESLGRFLGLTSAESTEIRNDHPFNYREQKIQCIKRWISKVGRNAMLIALLRVIYFDLQDRHVVTDVVKGTQNLVVMVHKILNPPQFIHL